MELHPNSCEREKEKESHQTNKSDLLGGDKVSWVWSITQVGSIKKTPARLQSNDEQIRESYLKRELLVRNKRQSNMAGRFAFLNAR